MFRVEVASCETIILVCHVAVGSRRLLTSKFSTNWGLSSLLLAKTGISAKAEVAVHSFAKMFVPLHKDKSRRSVSRNHFAIQLV